MPDSHDIEIAVTAARSFPAYVPPPAAPSVTRLVHYVSHGSADGRFPGTCRAALVTEVDPADPYLLGLCVINPTGLFFRPLVDGGSVANFVDHRDPGSWHWPEPVPDQAQHAQIDAETGIGDAVPLEQRVAAMLGPAGPLSHLLDDALRRHARLIGLSHLTHRDL